MGEIRSIEIERTEFDDNRKPCVYEVLNSIGEPIYVGSSDYGYQRVYWNTPTNHHNRNQAFEDMDKVKVTFFDTCKEAHDMEEKLIHTHHPKHNVSCAVCGCNDLTKVIGIVGQLQGPDVLHNPNPQKSVFGYQGANSTTLTIGKKGDSVGFDASYKLRDLVKVAAEKSNLTMAAWCRAVVEKAVQDV